ncbi:MAG TPA: hypothetical protein VMW29_00450 [Candidatus Bathyarchaeia archaeon]|nr:hypothetical protein [Candidatus Bathyarchaeia archaeon]
MSKITNKHIIKIKELVSDEVCMGTFGLVELELLEMEKDFSEQLQNTSSNSDYRMCKNHRGQGNF